MLKSCPALSHVLALFQIKKKPPPKSILFYDEEWVNYSIKVQTFYFNLMKKQMSYSKDLQHTYPNLMVRNIRDIRVYNHLIFYLCRLNK